MKVVKYIVVVILALTGIGMTEEQDLQYGPWTVSRMGGGGYLQEIVFSPSDSNVIYCAGDVGGLFKSKNGGKTWRMIHGTAYPAFYHVRGVSVDPRDSDIVLVATGGLWGKFNQDKQGIYRTVDGGKSWKFVCSAKTYGDTMGAGGIFARDRSNPDIVYAAAADGIFLSRNNGVNWENIGMSGYGPANLTMDTTDSLRLWFCALPLKKGGADTIGGFFITEDGGKNWTELPGSVPSEIHQAPWDPLRLYAIFNYAYPAVSEDGGKSWEKLTDGLESLAADLGKKPSDDKARYAAMTVGPDFVLLGSSLGSFYRLNKGETKWRKLPGKAHQGDWPISPKFTGGWQSFGRSAAFIAVDPRNPDHWMFSDWFAIYQTKDAGKNWYLTVDGVEMTMIHCVVPDPKVPGRVYVGLADLRILMSNNKGKTFFTAVGSMGNIKNIAISKQDHSRVYAQGPRAWSNSRASNTIYVSTRPETSWAMLPLAGIELKKERINTLVVSPTDANVLYVGRSGKIAPEQGGVYKSTDGGKSFVWFSKGMDQGKEFFHRQIWFSGPEVAVSADGKNLVAISGMTSDIYTCESNDGQWVKTAGSTPLANYAVVGDPVNPKRFYLASLHSGACRSDDGGKTWKVLYPGNVYDIACDPLVKDRIAITLNREEKILVSNDAGENWRELSNAIPNRRRLKLCFSGDILLAGTEGNGVFHTDLSKHPGTPVVVPAVPMETIRSNPGR